MMKNKRGDANIFWLAMLLVTIIAIVVIVLGSGGFFNKLWAKLRGVEENIGKQFEGIDFGVLSKEQEKKLCGDAQGYMNKLFSDAEIKRKSEDYSGAIALFEKYVGICSDKNENAKECSDKEFAELKLACTRKAEANTNIAGTRNEGLRKLEEKIRQAILGGLFDDAGRLLVEYEKLGGKEGEINSFKKMIEERKGHAESSFDKEIKELEDKKGILIDVTCKRDKEIIKALECQAQIRMTEVRTRKVVEPALRVYSELARRYGLGSPRIIPTYMAIGDLYETRGEYTGILDYTLTAYDLYEDLLVRYEGGGKEGYGDVINKINEKATKDPKNYKKIKFSKLKYDTRLHAGIEYKSSVYSRGYGWFTSSTGSKMSRSGFLDFNSPLVGGVGFNYDYKDDWDNQNMRPVVFTKGNTNEAIDISTFACLDLKNYYRYESDLIGNQETSGIVLNVIVKDVRNNELCNQNVQIMAGWEFGVDGKRVELCTLGSNKINLRVIPLDCETDKGSNNRGGIRGELAFNPLGKPDLNRYLQQ